ncbi:twin-arginine translocase TatA/TatE family subunit [Leifsonia shinshuensis]|uniref:twin-arginine translocase TatA/TatE family subunit n=1 Tax=Leifsonia shinshuensis TaxID=150026 RepID=UPI001F50FA5E|nr:twin-arginine translocase TatA/TatE family subunit [Leifsonia shinshuensis]MCI0159260.1 twin-arginine translocase TatA/TatE family subunit [Leifsonia shinshuensis]
MFGNLFSGWHLVILVALVLLLFGATKLPALAKGLGESIRILRKETKPSGSEPGDGGAGAATEAGPSTVAAGAAEAGATEPGATEPGASTAVPSPTDEATPESSAPVRPSAAGDRVADDPAERPPQRD